MHVLLNRSVFHKGYTSLWSPEVFVINRIRYTGPPIVYLTEPNEEEISGGWYLEEVQKVVKSGLDKWPIEKILRQKRINDVLHYFVRWFEYGKDYESWVVASNVGKI